MSASNYDKPFRCTYHPKVLLSEILNGPALSVFNLGKGNNGVLELKERQVECTRIFKNAGVELEEVTLLL